MLRLRLLSRYLLVISTVLRVGTVSPRYALWDGAGLRNNARVAMERVARHVSRGQYDH